MRLRAKAAANVDCGGKRSATPLWLRLAQTERLYMNVERKSGVALRLPPQSKRIPSS
jgi:hypothetical protein